MASEDRIAALRKRVHRQEDETPTPTMETASPTKPKSTRRSARGRHTVYLDKSIMDRIDQAFKSAAHELYPQEVEKADYLEACLIFALAHQDEIKRTLAYG